MANHLSFNVIYRNAGAGRAIHLKFNGGAISKGIRIADIINIRSKDWIRDRSWQANFSEPGGVWTTKSWPIDSNSVEPSGILRQIYGLGDKKWQDILRDLPD